MNRFFGFLGALDGMYYGEYVVRGSLRFLNNDLADLQRIGPVERITFTQQVNGLRGIRQLWNWIQENQNRYPQVDSIGWTFGDDSVSLCFVERRIVVRTANPNLVDLCRQEGRAHGYGVELNIRNVRRNDNIID